MKKSILAALDNLGIEYREEEHEAVFTVAESKKVLTEKVPVKSLLLQERKGDRLVLVVMAGDKRLQSKQVSEPLGLKKLEFAKPDVLKQALGVTPGSVSLFGLLHEGSGEVKVIIDEELTQEAELGFHPNDNTSTIFIPGDKLTNFIEHTDHKYDIINLE